MKLQTEITKLESEIQKLQEKQANSNKLIPSFEIYARDVRKMPSDKLYLEYLGEIQKILSSSNKLVPSKQALYVNSRRTWTDVVSETNSAKTSFSERQQVKVGVMERITELGYKDPENLYHACLDYLVHNTVITFTFEESFLTNELLRDTHILNAYERGNRDGYYMQNRKAHEDNYFSHLNAALKNQVLNNPHARPRYCALKLLDKNSLSLETPNYGRSFIVFKNLIKFNSLFAAADTLASNYQVCTIHNMEILLLEFPIATLEAVLYRVTKGVLPNDYSQDCPYHIEAMIPSVNIYDPSFIEHIHISSKHQLLESDINEFKKLGITVTNYAWGPYHTIASVFNTAIVQSECDKVATMLRKHPSLIAIADGKGRMPVHIAAELSNVKVMKLLLQAKANPFLYTPEHNTALHCAILAKNTSVVNLLLKDYKPEYVKNDWPDNTILHVAIKSNQIDLAYKIFKKISLTLTLTQLGNVLEKLFIKVDKNFIERVVANRPEVVNYVSKYGSILHLAIKHQKLDIIPKLREMGAKLTVKNNKKQNALQLAVKLKDPKAVTQLMEFDLSAIPAKQLRDVFTLLVKDENKTAINTVINKRPDVIKFLSNTQKTEILNLAVTKNDAALVTTMCQAGANLTKKNKLKISPLDFAIQNNNVALIKIAMLHTSRSILKKMIRTCFVKLKDANEIDYETLSQISCPQNQKHIGLAFIIQAIKNTKSLEDIEKLTEKIIALKQQLPFLQKKDSWSHVNKLLKNKILAVKLASDDSSPLKDETEQFLAQPRSFTFFKDTTSITILKLAEKNRNKAAADLLKEEVKANKWAGTYCAA